MNKKILYTILSILAMAIMIFIFRLLLWHFVVDKQSIPVNNSKDFFKNETELPTSTIDKTIPSQYIIEYLNNNQIVIPTENKEASSINPDEYQSLYNQAYRNIATSSNNKSISNVRLMVDSPLWDDTFPVFYQKQALNISWESKNIDEVFIFIIYNDARYSFENKYDDSYKLYKYIIPEEKTIKNINSYTWEIPNDMPIREMGQAYRIAVISKDKKVGNWSEEFSIGPDNILNGWRDIQILDSPWVISLPYNYYIFDVNVHNYENNGTSTSINFWSFGEEPFYSIVSLDNCCANNGLFVSIEENIKSLEDILTNYKDSEINYMPEEMKKELREYGFHLETTVTNIDLPIGVGYVISSFSSAGEEHESHTLWIIHNDTAYKVHGIPFWYEHKDQKFDPIFDKFLRSMKFIY